MESSKNEKTAYQNIANTIKAVLKGTFTTASDYTKNRDRISQCYLRPYKNNSKPNSDSEHEVINIWTELIRFK